VTRSLWIKPTDALNSVCYQGQDAPGSKRSLRLHKMYQCRCTAKNSWWWAEWLPETCRVVIPIKLEFSASVGFIHKDFLYCWHWHVAKKYTHTHTQNAPLRFHRHNGYAHSRQIFVCLHATGWCRKASRSEVRARLGQIWMLISKETHYRTHLLQQAWAYHKGTPVLTTMTSRSKGQLFSNAERTLNVGFREFPHILQTNSRTAFQWG
jgi:hypothetical protein